MHFKETERHPSTDNRIKGKRPDLKKKKNLLKSDTGKVEALFFFTNNNDNIANEANR